MDDGRAMHAVKDRLAPPYGEVEEFRRPSLNARNSRNDSGPVSGRMWGKEGSGRARHRGTDEGSRSEVRGFRNFESRLSRMSRASRATVRGVGDFFSILLGSVGF